MPDKNHKNKNLTEYFDTARFEYSLQRNPNALPIIEEIILQDFVLRVRDWQETIDKKFGRKEAYLEFENEEVNTFKKELLEKDKD